MNMKLMTLMALPLLALSAAAMPTKDELKAVEPVVADLMKPEQKALKAGEKTKSDVAAAALKLVDAADSEAAKLLLAKGAYNLYVRDGDFEKAIETLQTMREKVADLEPKYLANIIETSLRTISRKHGGQLYQLLDETRACVRYQAGLKDLEAELKKKPTDKNLNLKLAEHHAILGDWPSALDAFERAHDRKAAEAATAEKTGAKVLKPHADYWWDYPNRKAPEYTKPFRQHAAKLYAQAIATGEISGLHKVQADRRIAEAAAMGATLCLKKEELGGVQLWENGPYWAECNVGASKPEESGYYFWWGDTVGYKRVGDRWDAVDGSRPGFSFNDKNCPTYGKDKSQLLSAGYIDATGNLTSAHDAATAHLGVPWRMPTDAEFDALMKNCDTEWTTRNGIPGRLVKGRGVYALKSIFLPAAGDGGTSYRHNAGSSGRYWFSTPYLNTSNDAWSVIFCSGYVVRDGWRCRSSGRSVRPVRGPIQASSEPRLSQNSANAVVRTAQPEPEARIAAQRKLAKERAARDIGVYGEAMKEIESLYMAFSKTGDRQAFKSLVSKYPKANRTGCAALYVAQRMQGARQIAALTEVIEKFGDCYYGDGCNVGALARYHLVVAAQNQGDKARAKAVADELRRNSGDAIGHDGALIVDKL